ncbi:hypothetical protein [Paenibacillus aestuarii]|uniref:Uncharacterized protein n=1 Tax=Paenibacillus aestuarii TaxID=516965 RepID=A0ABW0KDW0_9BACL|nr:hypothetical protein [Paenibacillus aestuarii]
MDIYLKIFILVWLIFIYGIVAYRMFIRKGGKMYTKENTGLIIIAFTMLINNQLHLYLRLSFVLIGAALMISLLMLRRKA